MQLAAEVEHHRSNTNFRFPLAVAYTIPGA